MRGYPLEKLAQKPFVIFESEDSNLQEGRVQDISQSGAFLWECYTEKDTSKVSFQIHHKKPIEKKCRIVRKDIRDPWIVVSFDKPLSRFEFDRIKGANGSIYLPGNHETYDLAKIDRAEVFKEANQIKTCSSNYFIWSIGLILPFTLAIWALVLEKKLNAISASSSMIGIMMAFCVAVFSNIEKARAINKREGFIAALDFYLKDRQGPMNYRGWVNLKHCYGECGARRRAKICPKSVDPKSNSACRDIGEKKAIIIRLEKRVFPSILDSFISLTSFSYFLVFFGLVILTLISFKNTWEMLYNISALTT